MPLAALRRPLPLLLWALATLAATPQAAAAPAEPYTLTVWARVLFDAEGRARDPALVDAEQYPPAFAQQVLARVAMARIAPPLRDGRAVTLRTGVQLRFTITPGAGPGGGGLVRLDGLEPGAVPLKRYLASYPADARGPNAWQGEALGVCRIGTDGRCAAIEVQALPGVPDSVRRHLRASLQQWSFEPAQIDGEAVEGEHRLRLVYRPNQDMPEDFRQDKFDRIMRSR